MPRQPREENLRLRALLDEAGMSNKGLARRVVDLAAVQGVANVRCDHTSVLRWLAGEQPRPPVPELVVTVLSDALGRKVSETQLGMTPSSLPGDLGLQISTGWTETVATSTALWRADMQRRRFLVNAVFTSAALPASALRWLTSPPANAPAASGLRRIGRTDIDAIRAVATSYREMDNRLGGGKLRHSVVSYLDDHVSRLLTTGTYQEETGRQLAAACGEVSQLAGWVAYDSGEHGLAQRYLTQALAYARHADDPALAAEVLAAQAHQALYLARPDEAIDLARTARAAAARHGSATLLTECLVMEAHGHAARNDAHACGAALAEAERTFDRAISEDEPTWLAYFDEAYLAARMAQCFRDLGEADHAARYARRSLDMDGRYVRGRAFNLSLLAAAHAAQDEPERACAVGQQALDLTARLTSARSVWYVRDVVRRLRPRADVPAVRDFAAEVRERLPAAAGHTAPR
jgi:tetratricopeptide (TPR) repeat protein